MTENLFLNPYIKLNIDFCTLEYNNIIIFSEKIPHDTFRLLLHENRQPYFRQYVFNRHCHGLPYPNPSFK